jgi:hypothetical protein
LFLENITLLFETRENDMKYHTEKLLILANTYPNPSAKYRETNCVAAVNEGGELRRLFPIPYRLLDGTEQFKKWEWISAPIMKSNNDHRPESHRIDVDRIYRGYGQMPPGKLWPDRLAWILPHVVDDFETLEQRRQTTQQTLGILGPVRLLGLEIEPETNPTWTPEEIAKLSKDGLFDTEEVRNRAPLRKLPYRFYYSYEIGGQVHRHLITDWEAGALYWNCLRLYGPQWEEKFRQKYEVEFSNRDLLLLMGTIHRFPDRWLIVSVIYAPKGTVARAGQERLRQSSLFD